MPNAVVFFDLDGTLLADDKSLLPSTLAAMTSLRQHDILPVVATGRNLFEIQYVLDATQIDSIVSANGSYVQLNGQPIATETIPPAVITRFNVFAAKFGDPVGWYTHQGFALSAASTDTKENYALLRLAARVDRTWWQARDINFMFVFDRGRDAEFQAAFAGELDLVRNNIRGLDVMNHGVSKRTGIMTLLAQAGLAHLPTYGFGDAANDLPMLQLVDHPVVMANGEPAAKALAEFITTSNTADGIANGLRHYGLID
ncbi:Cof-type HAD-IIB family hydrolase [Lacticaseibacillus nasuensis]|uniref:HAD superfamily hydrolase n=1 Tax=Lacticaseibacillus nasuensis JCM 17158 TaxID=1291734 RepID=A0A0R1K0N1_9LACO|nr:Cof-type HAD-IIB family hydrolase [Lacticaseibacillus nasuensis]KRK74209.1 HAD superfamily hydrolase [Lacticaseibacillus nasuensis JCM 17158]